MELLVDLNREYRRFRPNVSEKVQLTNIGMQWVLSSNVSAIGVDGKDLIIRFHNGSLYSYSGQAKLYEPMLQSNSKGHFVWVKLRRKGVPYKKIGSLPFKNDAQVTDDELFQLVEQDGMNFETRLQNIGLVVVRDSTGMLQTISSGQMGLVERVTKKVIDVFEFEPMPQMWKRFTGAKKEAFSKTYETFKNKIESVDKKDDGSVPIRQKTTYFYKKTEQLFPKLNIKSVKTGGGKYSSLINEVSITSVEETLESVERNTETIIHELGHAIDNNISKSALGMDRFISTGFDNERKSIEKKAVSWAKKAGISKSAVTDFVDRKVKEFDDKLNSLTREQYELVEASNDFALSVEKYTGKYEDLRKTEIYATVKKIDEERKAIQSVHKIDETWIKVTGENEEINNVMTVIRDYRTNKMFGNDTKEYEDKLASLNIDINDTTSTVQKYREAYEKNIDIQRGILDAYKPIKKKLTEEFDEINVYYTQASDTLDALSRGNFQTNHEISHGHGKSYYKDDELLKNEVFTHLMTTSTGDPKVYKAIEKEFPEITRSFERIIDTSYKLLNKGNVK